MIRRQIGARLKELRQKLGLSQEKFALEIGLDRTYIASIELGKRNVSCVNLQKIWQGLGVSPKEFFDSKIFEEKK
ncbi:MAG: helix-turn-helix transcriptional regulator [Proteobacteria bacterium]|uniref:Helix-turn-helix transcriptional regulator n=1 Tax=Candidatus Avisuccinivibrio stercorigallinarum TaxID=2840704 RepID=A0A9D9DBF2_9GAMM|nr:helix-turn-helix transcriptional regulator [Candidatus Avisuccinivibrio stercorigallinarum]